jgi:hypothetical protein
MGILSKLYLQFPEIFWDEEARFIGYVDAEARGRWGECLNLADVVKQPILLCFNAGQFGQEVESWSDADIIEGAMSMLRTIYGEAIPALLGICVLTGRMIAIAMDRTHPMGWVARLMILRHWRKVWRMCCSLQGKRLTWITQVQCTVP